MTDVEQPKFLPRVLAPKPSDTLTAMINGLEKWDKDPTKFVTMETFGDTHHGMCYGCAATTAVMELVPEASIHPLDRRLDMGLVVWSEYERMIDSMRYHGDVSYLEKYYDVELPFVSLPSLKKDWRSNLQEWVMYRNRILEMGL